MVSVKLQGGIGNNMFQAAAAIGTARKFNDAYCIPENKYFPHLTKCNQGAVTAQVYNEPSFEYNEIPKPASNNLFLQGYFQSEKYWLHCKDEIIEAFNIPYEKKEGWVSISVRRGDYLTKPDYHPVITMEYISRAISIFTMTGYNKFMVFGDDPDWNHENINEKNFPNCEFEYSEGRTPLEDISLISGCEHNICSNSTFAFWGAYLNRNTNKIVLVTEKWFGKDGPKSTSDLIPENWIRL